MNAALQVCFSYALQMVSVFHASGLGGGGEEGWV